MVKLESKLFCAPSDVPVLLLNQPNLFASEDGHDISISIRISKPCVFIMLMFMPMLLLCPVRICWHKHKCRTISQSARSNAHVNMSSLNISKGIGRTLL